MPDDAIIRLMVAEQLKDAGLAVTEAGSADEAQVILIRATRQTRLSPMFVCPHHGWSGPCPACPIPISNDTDRSDFRLHVEKPGGSHFGLFSSETIRFQYRDENGPAGTGISMIFLDLRPSGC